MKLCQEVYPSEVFHHYAYGDPLPVYARYAGENGPVKQELAITVYIQCEREENHPGKHLARGVRDGWE